MGYDGFSEQLVRSNSGSLGTWRTTGINPEVKSLISKDTGGTAEREAAVGTDVLFSAGIIRVNA